MPSEVSIHGIDHQSPARCAADDGYHEEFPASADAKLKEPYTSVFI